MQVEMNEDKYVAAIEVSSSKIIAAVGKIHPDGMLDIIASEQERNVESVRYGIIKNLDQTSVRINRIIEMLERKADIAPREITSIYVGLSGQSVRSISTDVRINLPEDTEITREIVDRLREQAGATAIDNSLEVVDVIPRCYRVGTSETTSPIGTVGSSISATYDLIVCRPELRRNLSRTISEKNELDIKGYIVTALATASDVLTSDEKRLGCMLVDMGAETTTVSIYKEGHLMYFATLPLGGRNITRDITSLSVLEEKAEDIKKTSGNALPRDIPSSLSMGGIRMSDVSNLIVARSEEIVANIVQQITYAGLEETQLTAGIICVGGGIRLNGMTDLLAEKTGLNVRKGQLPQYIRLADPRTPAADVIQVASILYTGARDEDCECLSEPDREELPSMGTANATRDNDRNDNSGHEKKERKPRKPGFFSRIGDKFSNFFTGDDDSELI